MRCLGLGLALVGAAAGVVVGVVAFVVALVFAVASPSVGFLALAALAGIVTSGIAALSAAGAVLPLKGRAGAMAVLGCAALHFLLYAAAGAWPVALPACVFLFPAGLLLVADESDEL